MNLLYWAAGLFRRWLRTKPDPGGARINFSARLRDFHEDGWVSPELLLVNRSTDTVWVEDATIVLSALEANWQTSSSTGQAIHEIRQNIEPNEISSLSLARAIYDAAGRPQGPYSCLVLTNVRYRVFDEWCDLQLKPCRVEMVALAVVNFRQPRWYDKKIKQINGPVNFTKKEKKG